MQELSETLKKNSEVEGTMRQLAMKYIGGRITTEVSDEIRIRNYTPEDFESNELKDIYV